MSKGIIVWLARDEDYPGPDYILFRGRKPTLTQGMYCSDKNCVHVSSFCSRDFERQTRYRLKPGECKRVRISVEEVK